MLVDEQIAGSEKRGLHRMVFGGLSNRVTSNVHRGRRTHSPPLPSDSSKWVLAAPRLLCFSIPWTHTSVLSDCGATTYLHAALHCPRAQTSAVTHHHTCRFGVYTPSANGPWHNSGSSTECSSEKHLFRLLADEKIVGAEKRGLRRWCLKHQAWYMVAASVHRGRRVLRPSSVHPFR